MRKNLFEQINTSKPDLAIEAMKIEASFSLNKSVHIYNGYYNEKCSLEEYINAELFSSWPYRYTFVNTIELKENFGISIDLRNGIKKMDLHVFLTYCEFILNMVNFSSTRVQFIHGVEISEIVIDLILTNISRTLDSVEYESAMDGDMIVIRNKNAAAIAVSEVLDTGTAIDITNYNRFAYEGNVWQKAKLLSSIANAYEAIVTKLKASGETALVSEISFLLNSLNIRHNNADGVHEKEFLRKFQPEDFEKWYDRTYKLLLLAFLKNECAQYKFEIADLKREAEKKV